MQFWMKDDWIDCANWKSLSKGLKRLVTRGMNYNSDNNKCNTIKNNGKQLGNAYKVKFTLNSSAWRRVESLDHFGQRTV